MWHSLQQDLQDIWGLLSKGGAPFIELSQPSGVTVSWAGLVMVKEPCHRNGLAVTIQGKALLNLGELAEFSSPQNLPRPDL